MAFQWAGLGIITVLLAGCSSGAPPAPMGFDRKPANPPSVIAGLKGAGVRTSPNAPPASDQSMPPPETAADIDVSATTGDIPPIILSDYVAPDGIASLAQAERERLVSSAMAARTVSLLSRGDRSVPSETNWNEILHRGAKVRAYLIGQGISPKRVRLFIRSAGGFVADNKTPEGRARNRRVEIHFG